MLFLAAACTHGGSKQTAYMQHLAYAAATDTPSYPLAAAFGPHPVPLTASERMQIERILKVPYYRRIRARLRFAFPNDRFIKFVVFQSTDGKYGEIAGSPCLYLKPGGEIGPAPAGCTPDEPRTP